MNLPVFRLNKNADKRLLGGHLWIYSNEIDNNFSPLKSVSPGDEVVVENFQGKPLGIASINPNTLICGRLLTRDVKQPFEKVISMRFQNALKLRQLIFDVPCYRLVFGESDWLPGLVIDRFFDTVVIQVSTTGMEKYIPQIIESLEKLIKPKTILLKNDGKMREAEGLPIDIRWLKGEGRETTLLEENGVKFRAPLIKGQKTGWFYDHRMNRARLKDYVKGKRVLDVFSYIGGWGIQAATFGASEVLLNDSSAFALEMVDEQTRLNKLENIKTLQGDAFKTMENLIADNEKFDVVILDPPAFIPRRKDINKGMAAYKKANQQALQLLRDDGGVLFSASCSMHLSIENHKETIRQAGRKNGRFIQVLEQGHQAADHPVHPSIPETEYLKTFVVYSKVI